MSTLYHHPLCPLSRYVRIALGEKRLDYAAEIERYWELRPEFMAMNPAGEVPVLVEDNGAVLAEASAIAEYLDEVHSDVPLLPADPVSRAETRRLVGWFTVKFHREVTTCLIGEKVMKRLTTPHSAPDSRAIRLGYAAVHRHLDYIGWLAEHRPWLAGPAFTLADIAAAAQISVLDYCGDVPWENHGPAKDWYARIKSRPSFRPLLQDRLPGLPPPMHYSNPDF